MPDDAALIRQFADTRSEAAFAELVRRHLDTVYSSALRRLAGDTHLAEDATQQVFITLARHPHAVATHPAITAWLHLTTRNVAAHIVRTERRRRAREQASATMHDSAPDPSASADWSRLAPIIDGEIDRLNEPDRIALLLRFFENRRFSEIGQALRLSEDAARMRVDRALEKLRLALVRRGLTSTSAALASALATSAISAAPPALATTIISSAVPASSGAGALGVLSIMTSGKTALAVAATAALITLGIATRETLRAHAAQSALESARQQYARSASQLAALHQQHAHVIADISKLEQTSTSPSSAPSPSSPAQSARGHDRPITPHLQRDPAADAFMARHPEVKKALVDWVDAKTRYEWSDFYAQLHLTPAQIARYEQLKRERTSIQRPLGAGGDYAWFSAGSEGLSRDEIEARLRELLGPDGYAARSAYSARLPARAETATVASALGFTDTPLTPDQAARLTEVIHTSRLPGSARGIEFDWDAIRQKASDILSPAQHIVLDRVRLQSEYDAAFSRAMTEALTTARPSSP
jgi:RNA polymerase sigma factor, sigma-70 family